MRRPGRTTAQVYQALTRGVLVRVAAHYLPEDSTPSAPRHVWSYQVEIENHGDETVQLMSRRWLITDGLNRTEEVSGEGVVGEQPILKPREAFRYSSRCQLPTTSGVMRGIYQMITPPGDVFDAEIPAFSLHLPEADKKVN
jgi:ApaG protein